VAVAMAAGAGSENAVVQSDSANSAQTRRFLIILTLPFKKNKLSGHRFHQKIPE
jgi:hypothetical protein